MRDGLRAIHGADSGEDEPTADAARGQPAAGRGGNGNYHLSAGDRRARHLSRRNGYGQVPADRSVPRQARIYRETTAADPIEARICEMVETEWGVAYERRGITACESEQAARQLQAASGGELVYRRTWITSWV